MQSLILGQPVTFDVLQGVCISVERYSEYNSFTSGGNGLIIDGTGSIAPITSEAWTTHRRRVAFESDDRRRLVLDFPAEFDVEANDQMTVVVAQVASGERHVTDVANRSTGGRYGFGFDFQSIPFKGRVKQEVKKTSALILVVISVAAAFIKLFASSGKIGFVSSVGPAIFTAISFLFWGFVLRMLLLRLLEKSLRSDARKDFNTLVRNKAAELAEIAP